MPTFVAVDLGASSGRVVRVHIDEGPDAERSIRLDVVHRFPTPAVTGPAGELTWDFDAILQDVRSGIANAVEHGPVESIAIDSWGVDYGLIDGRGRRVGPVHAYRSARTQGVMADVVSRVGRERIYRITGIQFMSLNTAYQLVAARETAEYLEADRLLMVPDLINHALCGSTTNEVTNASTTQLLDVSTRQWSDELVAALSLRRDVLPDLHEPGTHLGRLRGISSSVDGTAIVAAASHDTASAVVGTPLGVGGEGIYISCGTWALVGCERSAPITAEAALAANVTNELGVDGSVRLLKNVTGLWLLEECRRTWAAAGQMWSAAELVAAAEAAPGGRSVVDPDDDRFATPGDMPARIAGVCAATGQRVPDSPPETIRVVLDSIALSWRRTIATIERVSGQRAPAIHLVGGGSQIPLLRRLSASASGRSVIAGPTEATVLGNAIVQAVAFGCLPDVSYARQLVRRSLDVEEVSPEPTLDWDALDSRLAEVTAQG